MPVKDAELFAHLLNCPGADARQAEWEKAKQALHQSLLEQQNQVLAEATSLQQNLSDTAKNALLVQARFVSLELQRKEELDKILSDLQKKYNLGWLGNLFLFLPSNRQVEFEERAARIRAKYESIKESLEASLYREITQVYGISLNQIKSSHKIDSVQIKK